MKGRRPRVKRSGRVWTLTRGSSIGGVFVVSWWDTSYVADASGPPHIRPTYGLCMRVADNLDVWAAFARSGWLEISCPSSDRAGHLDI